MSDHERWADAAGAYVLGAMPQGERQAYEAHMVECEMCRDEVDELRPAAQALPVGAPPMRPPPALKDRIMAEVEREAALLAEAGPSADRPPRRRRRWSFLSGWRLAPVAATVLAVGVLAGFVVAGIGGDGAQIYRATVDRAQLQDASAYVEVKDGNATFVADGLPEPAGAYQLWIMPKDGDTPVPSELVLPRDGEATAAVPGAEDAAAVLMTREPKDGATVPSEQPVITVTMPS
jgi:anti-sigma-K factor RskA